MKISNKNIPKEKKCLMFSFFFFVFDKGVFDVFLNIFIFTYLSQIFIITELYSFFLQTVTIQIIKEFKYDFMV